MSASTPDTSDWVTLRLEHLVRGGRDLLDGIQCHPSELMGQPGCSQVTLLLPVCVCCFLVLFVLLLHLIPFTVQQKRQSVWEMCKIQPHELDCESSLWTIPEIKGGDPRTDLGRPRDHFGETPGAVWAAPSGNVPKTRFSGRRPWRPFSGPVAPRNPRISADPGTSLRLFMPI